MPASDTLYRIDRDLFSKAAATLIGAFSNDHIVKRLGLGQKMIRMMYETPLRIGFRYGEVLATSDTCEGVMVFCSDEKANLSLGDMIKNGMLFNSLGLLRLLANKDMRSLFATVERDRKALEIGPYYYLMVIGVLPEYQGQGYGGQMLRYLCKRADSEARTIYLETQTEENAQWYKRFGFQVVKEVTFSEWLTLWEMVREAKLERHGEA